MLRTCSSSWKTAKRVIHAVSDGEFSESEESCGAKTTAGEHKGLKVEGKMNARVNAGKDSFGVAVQRAAGGFVEDLWVHFAYDVLGHAGAAGQAPATMGKETNIGP